MKPHSLQSARAQGGFALIAALFLIVVLAGLGAFAMQVNTAQQSATDLELLGARARFAAQAGVEYAARRLEQANACSAVDPTPPALANGMSVAIACQLTSTHTVNGVPRNVYALDVRATSGAYGSPDRVSRRVRAHVMI